MAVRFLNSLMSYLLVFLVFVLVMGVAITLGITIRKLVDKAKRKNEEA